MSKPHIAVVGAGAAGSAAVRFLGSNPDVTVTAVDSAHPQPYNRTLVDKGVAVSLITPEQAALPSNGVPLRRDAVTGLVGTQLTFASAEPLDADAVIIATGSSPTRLNRSVPGAAVARRLTTLHSLDDAVSVRDTLAQGPATVAVLGGGLLAHELASLLLERGHAVTLIARSLNPGAASLGSTVAEALTARTSPGLRTMLGRHVMGVSESAETISLHLDDQTTVTAALAVVAHGTAATPPSPWDAAMVVDEHLRVLGDRALQFAAGGVALHHDNLLGQWRIDHWADAAAQGQHAAQSALHFLDLGDDPGPYRPTTVHVASVNGMMVMGAGYSGPTTQDHVISTDPLLVLHRVGDVIVGVTGIDAPALVSEQLGRLFTRLETPA